MVRACLERWSFYSASHQNEFESGVGQNRNRNTTGVPQCLDTVEASIIERHPRAFLTEAHKWAETYCSRAKVKLVKSCELQGHARI